MNLRFLLVTLSLLMLAHTASGDEFNPTSVLWFDRPAGTWEEALPVGNGRLGAMVFGGVEQARYGYNEDTLWTGHPHDYAHQGAHQHLRKIRQLLFDGRQQEAEELAEAEFMSVPLRQNAYQPFGELQISVPAPGAVSGYRRWLDLTTAIASVSYEASGVTYTRECFSSAVDNALVIHYSASRKGMISLAVGQTTPHADHAIQVVAAPPDPAEREPWQIHLSGSPAPFDRLPDMSSDLTFHSVATVDATGGAIRADEQQVVVDGADAVTIQLVAATSFVDFRTLGANPQQRCTAMLAALRDKPYSDIKQSHIADHERYDQRTSLQLPPGANSSRPTDERLNRFSENPEDDLALVALTFHYGRYLLLACSRPGTQPANLQGLWNPNLSPAWGSKYTCNINTEMNYWLAEVCNLAECQEPLFQLLHEVAQSGQSVAREHYQAGGWVLHHNTDLWRGTAPINASNHGIWVTGGAWLCQHLWWHYAFTEDLEFLRQRAYPVMKGACEFYLDFLIEDPRSPEKYLISTPSNSPEIGGLVAGPTMDHQIIRNLLDNTAEAAELLGVDEDFRQRLRQTKARLAPNRVGQYGQLQEWLEDKDDPQNKHRHVSHLWGLHPGREITRRGTPELFEACKVTLAQRGDGGTGWSMGWKINFWARLQDGDHAFRLIRNQLRLTGSDKTTYRGGGTYPNLLDAHPPFQIDGNFGFASGVAEMLLQSHTGELQLLPALPAAWSTGELTGLKARGNITVDLSWKNGTLAQARLTARRDKTIPVRLGEVVVDVELAADRPAVIGIDRFQ